MCKIYNIKKYCNMAQMLKKQTEIVCESTSIIKMDGQEIITYVNSFGQSLLVCSRHIDYNRNINSYDMNAIAYAAYPTADGEYILIFTRDPYSIHIFNIKKGQMLVARGLEEMKNNRVIAVAVQPESQVKQGSQTRKLNIIYDNRGSIYFIVIQIQPIFDNNPKTRTKLIQQNLPMQSQGMKVDPIFSGMVWNNFILCKKQAMRVCKGVKKGQEITFNFAIQAFEPNLLQLFSRMRVLGMAQSTQTWAIVCGGSYNSRGDQNMTINIFWQHFQSNELSRNMYYRDNSFIKNFELPNTERDFVKVWFHNGCYIVETRAGYNNHQCHIVPQKVQSTLVTLKLMQNSSVCFNSININSTQVSICEIVNKRQLFKTKLYEKEKQISPQNMFSRPSTNISTNASSNQMKPQPKKEIQTSIKQFAIVPETHNQHQQENKVDTKVETKVEVKTQVKIESKIENRVETKIETKVEEGKNTVKKIQNPFSRQKKQQPVKQFINEKIVEHLSKNEKKVQQSSINSEELQVPSQMQKFVSFGAPIQMKPKPNTQNMQTNNSVISFGVGGQNKSSIGVKETPPANLLSFGAPTNKPSLASSRTSATSAQQPSKKTEVKEIKNQNISKQKAQQITQTFSKLVKSMIDELSLRQSQFSNSYSKIPIKQALKTQPVFTKEQQSHLINIEKAFVRHKMVLDRKRQARQNKNKYYNENKTKMLKVIEQCESLLGKLQMNTLQNLPEFKSLRKIMKKNKQKKSFEQQIQQNISQIKNRVEDIETKTEDIIKKSQQKLYKSKEKKSLKLKQIMKLMNQVNQPSPQKQIFKMKIPLCRNLYICDKTPLIKLNPC